MKKNTLFISCEEAHRICDKSQYHEATLLEKIKLKIRFSWCKVTRAYSKRNKALTKAIEASNIECLKAHERKEIQKQFDNELKNQN